MQYGYGYGAGRRWRSGGPTAAPGDIAITWREGADGGVVAEDVDSALPVEIADLSAARATSFSLLADPDSKFDIVDNGNGTAVLRIDSAIAYSAATVHSFTIEATNALGSSYYAGEVSLYEVVVGQAPTAISFAAAAIAFGNVIPEDADSTLPLFLGTISSNGSHPLTIAETADADNKFTVTDNGNGTASLYLDAAVANATDASHSVTVQATNANGSKSQEFVFSVAAATNDSGVDQGDGTVIGDPNFSETVTARNVSGSLKITGKNSAEAKFLFDLGVPQANTSYTVKYDPDFTRLSLLGAKALVGFGFKETSQNTSGYHFVGLKGDGSTGLNKARLYSSTFKNSGYTSAGVAAASHGTQAGPNWARLVISADGATYKFYTSADGVSWTEEYTGITPTPLSGCTSAAEFGIAALFEKDDKGAFSIEINVWISESVSSVPTNTTAPVISIPSTVSGQVVTDTNADVWTGSPTSYARQWKRDGVDIAGETGATYTTTDMDIGSTITLSKTATNAAGTSSAATSNSVGPILSAASWGNTYTSALGANSSGWSGYTIANKLDAAVLSRSGSKVRVTVKGPITVQMVIGEMFIGRRNAGFTYNGTPTRVTFNGGSNGVTVTNQAEVVSDEIDFALDETLDYMFTIYFSGGTSVARGGTAGLINWKVGNTASSYPGDGTTQNGPIVVSKIESYG